MRINLLGGAIRKGLSQEGMRQAVKDAKLSPTAIGGRAVEVATNIDRRTLSPTDSMRREWAIEDGLNKGFKRLKQFVMAVAVPFVSIKFQYKKAKPHKAIDNTIDEKVYGIKKCLPRFLSGAANFGGNLTKRVANGVVSATQADQFYAYKSLNDVDKYILRQYTDLV